MDVTENYPSLINCLETGQSGLFLDLDFHTGDQTGAFGSTSCMGPFSETIAGRIKTDGGDVIRHVLLVLQRDRYDSPGSLSSVNNIAVETAWQNAFKFYQNSEPAKAPVFFKHQVNPEGKLQPLPPLFCCHKTKQWFHPVCPQCGLALSLCRDDALLLKRGLPAYCDSLERFLYCGSCATLSESSPFYCRDKIAGMPDIVHDVITLVTQWKQLLDKFPDDTDLPCRGCPDRDACYGPESLVSGRIVPFRFFPFYMMMFPAPSCLAAEFIRSISGDTVAAPWAANMADIPSGQSRFFFQDQDRQFLEILYLKLTFLAQVCSQLMPAESSATPREFNLSLEGIGVDLHPAGAGLPAYWNFNVRILDAVGAFQVSPFAPIMPEAPRLHFLGAVWFRTLLVNSRQQADTVYAEVGRLLGQKDIETPEIDTTYPLGVFAGSQIFWVPDQRNLAENWQTYWNQAIRMGFELVHAGMKTGVSWDLGRFLSALDALRNQIRDEMFSGPAITSASEGKTAVSDKISVVLNGILRKWQAASEPAGSRPLSGLEPEHPETDDTILRSPAKKEPSLPSDRELPVAADLHASNIPGVPPEDADWKADIEETMIFSSAGAAPPSESMQRGGTEPQLQESQWNDDIEETVVLRSDSTTHPARPASSVDDMDRTVVISAPSTPPDASLTGKEEDLAATMIQNTPVPPPHLSGEDEGDLEATVVLNASDLPDPNIEAPSVDDDLAATMIQGSGNRQPAPSPMPGLSGLPSSAGPPSSARSANGEDLDATVIINPAGHHLPSNHSPVIPSGPTDDDLTATLVETPRDTNRPRNERPLSKDSPSVPPVPPQPPRGAPKSKPRDVSQRAASDQANDDDDIMEQTIIIRSDVKKE